MYKRQVGRLEEDVDKCLSFVDKFADRKLKDEYDWNGDIYRNLKEFLLTNTSNRHAYQILMDAHISIAFAAGRILDSKSCLLYTSRCV